MCFLHCPADISDGLLRVFGSVDALAVEACVLRGATSLANHLAAMRRVLDKVQSAQKTLCYAM